MLKHFSFSGITNENFSMPVPVVMIVAGGSVFTPDAIEEGLIKKIPIILFKVNCLFLIFYSLMHFHVYT